MHSGWPELPQRGDARQVAASVGVQLRVEANPLGVAGRCLGGVQRVGVADCGDVAVGGRGVTGRPSGTVTFLFTDIEGSTRRWEADPEGMRVALAAHDDVLRAAVEGRGGWLFKHTGDGVCAAFQSARAAVDAAVDAQRVVGLPVRMGVATGEAERRGDD